MTWEQSRPGRRVSARVRAFVFKRDGGVCQLKLDRICITTASECDHIIPLAHGGTDQPDNLRAVCKPCHARVTGQLGRQTQLDRQAKTNRNMSRSVGLDPDVDWELPEPPGIRLQRERAEQQRQARKARMADEDAELRRLAERWVAEQSD